ncbi:MAG: hypothetical protein BWZ01_00187 [Deltaproteobacteria bacterium ADurb.BinA179]|jgi:hypothetical protein|nr:MAG: hypothetical protein BWZ01_00187 [Deltaproteobacteria bacterium ADurb.BinA179]
MEGSIRLAGPRRVVEIFGIRPSGINAENGKKLIVCFRGPARAPHPERTRAAPREAASPARRPASRAQGP